MTAKRFHTLLTYEHQEVAHGQIGAHGAYHMRGSGLAAASREQYAFNKEQ